MTALTGCACAHVDAGRCTFSCPSALKAGQHGDLTCSRPFWGLQIDDTRSFLLDGDGDWPPFGWRKRRRTRSNYTDHVFFGHGRRYKEAMREFILLSGQVQLMPYVTDADSHAFNGFALAADHCLTDGVLLLLNAREIGRCGADMAFWRPFPPHLSGTDTTGSYSLTIRRACSCSRISRPWSRTSARTACRSTTWCWTRTGTTWARARAPASAPCHPLCKGFDIILDHL